MHEYIRIRVCISMQFRCYGSYMYPYVVTYGYMYY